MDIRCKGKGKDHEGILGGVYFCVVAHEGEKSLISVVAHEAKNLKHAMERLNEAKR